MTGVVINSMFINHFVDRDLRVEKNGSAENRGVDFEIGDIGNSEYLYWRLKGIS